MPQVMVFLELISLYIYIYIRVSIHPVFPGHVLFFRVQNSVWADFFNLAKCPGFLINDHLSKNPDFCQLNLPAQNF